MKFVVTVFRSKKNRQFYYRAVAGNHKLVLPSEGYERIAGALKAAKTLENRLKKATYKIFESKRNGKFYFHGKARNGKIVIASQGYAHKSTTYNTLKRLKSAKVVAINVI